MTAFADWPALAGGVPAPGDTLTFVCRRGIWGKVQGEVSDYRWIGRGPGFAEGCPDLAGALRLGAEDTPVTAPLWRRLKDRSLAVSVYPSRARDSAGRLTVVEKQVYEWPLDPGLPAALAALALLPEVARRDDTDWWDRRTQGDWGRPDSALPLVEPGPTPLVLPVAELQARIAAGAADLARAVTPADLHAFYRRLLAGRFPAPLHLGAPLSPAALAVLLLPLPRPWADRLSLAGGLCARRFAHWDLIRNWDAVASTLTLPETGEDTLDVDPRVDGLAAAAVQRLVPGAYRDRSDPDVVARLDPGPEPKDRACAS